MTKLKFTVIGLGHIGKRHAAIINTIPNAELKIVVRKSEEVRMKSEELPPDSKHLTLNSSLLPLNSSLLPLNSIAAICTPNYLHCAQAIEWMQKGYDVIIEKPMGLNAEECREVIEVARILNRKVFCVMQNRYSPPSKWLKELIGSGRLGKIYSVQVNCLWNRNMAYYVQSKWKGKLAQDGGTLFTQFSHFVDTVLWIFGDIKPTYARFHNFNHPEIEFEDSGYFDFEILSGGVGTFTYSTSAHEQNLESSITILAEHGSVKVGGQYMDEVLACNVKDYTMPSLSPTLPPNDYGTYKGSASNHAFVYANVVDVLNENAKIDCTPEEGLRVVEVIEEVYKYRVKR
jgi:UDP-N-acetyl-2-amino-2-deoxyglucuronate dehydrogenase